MTMPSYLEMDNIKGAISAARQKRDVPNNLTYHLKYYEEAIAILRAEIDLIEGKRLQQFDFIKQLSFGRILLVGEGNLSFSRSLLNFRCINPKKLTATTFERGSGLTSETLENASVLKRHGASALHGVNARNLTAVFGKSKFNTIVFQFPNMARRSASEGHNPNFVLVRDFLKSASRHVSLDGCVLISAVDSPHYRGAFQFELAAKRAGYLPPLIYNFDPKRFKGYSHRMTHRNGSALHEYNKFKTWVFALR